MKLLRFQAFPDWPCYFGKNNMKFCIFLFVRFCNHILNWFWIMVISLICLVCHQMIFFYDIGYGSHLTTPEYLYIVLSFSIKLYSGWIIFFCNFLNMLENLPSLLDTYFLYNSHGHQKNFKLDFVHPLSDWYKFA